MGTRQVVHIPPMPQPKDFDLNSKTEPSSPAVKRYEMALQAWERIAFQIATGGKDKSKKDKSRTRDGKGKENDRSKSEK